MITPNMPMPSTKTAAEQIAITGFLKSASGNIGCGDRSSTYRNATSITAATASSASTRVEVQPYSVAQVSASSSGTTQAINVAKPAQSICRAAARGFMCGNSREIAVTAIAPTGRFTQKQARQ